MYKRVTDSVALEGEQADDADANASAASESELTIVGVGASAGGLEALQHLVANLAESSRMAFVIAQHVSADYRSMMVDLLSRHSTLEVKAAEHGQQLQVGQVYVCPPGFHITVAADDIVQLSPVDESIYTTKPSIDLLFKSLADVKGPRSIGIILSGTGSDGASGVGAIKDVDGFSIAQDPSTAKYDGMPVSAIKSGKVDLILPPEDIGTELLAILPLADRPIPEFRSGRNRDAYERILRLLKRDHGVNFSQYKDKTLSRRILRRMVATKTESISQYAELLTTESEELNELFHDLLIGVTDFFRDADAYDDLRVALEEYIEEKADPFLRVWSVGCSTGEEPYSIAMLIAEILGDRLDEYRIQVFATDVNQRSIDQARRGRYSASAVSGMPKEMRDKYFVFVDGQYEVAKRIKQLVVLSQHDMVQDPPFLRQDLVVCRNVMIYFGSELQELLLPTFHYVLHPGALLFIGQAEAVGPHHELWNPVSVAGKIFRASASVHRSLPAIARNSEFAWQPERIESKARVTPKKRTEAEIDAAVALQLEKMLSPNVIVLNSSDNILYAHGDANPLLQRKAGLATDHVFQNVVPDVVVDLRTALHRLRAGEEIVSTDYRSVEVGGESAWVRLVLGTTASPQLGDLTIIYCQVEESLGAVVVSDESLGTTSASVVMEHEKQVSRLREQLAIVMEQLDSSNEEMQALNEELQSSNEELQSSNEELETTNEELQSTNEELQTAYAELRIAFDEKATQEMAVEATAVELAESNDLLMMAESVGRTGSWRWRPSDDPMMWSLGLHSLLGTDPLATEPSIDQLLRSVHKDDRSDVESHLESLLRGGDDGSVAFRLKDSDPVVWLSMVSEASLGQYKQVQEVHGTVRNVTQQREAETFAELQQARIDAVEDNVRRMLDENVNGVYVFDLTTQLNEFVNTSCVSLLGYSREDFDAHEEGDFVSLFHPDDTERVLSHFAAVAALGLGESRTIGYRFKHKDGHYLDLYSSDSVFAVNEEGEAIKTLGSFVVVNEAAY
ncbi:MAG: chemotaxis protein CheB [Ilumatobacter sp.]